jgi:hypothetical protein
MIANGLSASEGSGGVRSRRGRAVHEGVTIGVHGGFMGRSLSRFSLLIGSALAGGSLLAACASAVPGPAVIAQPASAQVAQPAPAGDFLAGLEQAVASELSAIDSTQTDNEPPAVIVELNALSNESSLIQAESFGSLVTTGANQIAKRERLLNALIASVRGTSYLTGVEVNGSSLSASILGLLNHVSSEVQAQAGSLEAAALPDQLRAVIVSIGPSTRVLGIVQPAVHLLVAAGEELNAARLLELQYANLSQKAYLHHGGIYKDLYAEESQRLQDLKSDISTVTSTATQDIDAIFALTPAGFPGNKTTIQNVRAQLVQLKAPLGPLNAGLGDVNAVTLLLTQLP